MTWFKNIQKTDASLSCQGSHFTTNFDDLAESQKQKYTNYSSLLILLIY